MAGTIKNRIKRVTLWALSITILLMAILILLLQFPGVQTRIAQYASGKLSEQLGFQIEISKVEISWFDHVALERIRILQDDDKVLLASEEIEINYQLIPMLREELKIDFAIINGLDFKLAYHNSDTLNITVFINKIKSLIDTSEGQSQNFRIEHIELNNSSFSYQVDDSPIESKRFNYKNFMLQNINAYVSHLQIKPDTFLIAINSLEALDKGTNTRINKLTTQFQISSQTMRFDSLQLELEKSALAGSLVFEYDDYSAFSNFVENVEVTASFNQSQVYSRQLRLFSSYFDKINDSYYLKGNFRGEIADFKVRNLDLSFGTGSRLTGSLDFEGLPAIYETFIDINLKRSKLNENDLVQYIPVESFATYNRFNEIIVNGTFTGYIDDFVANGRFETNLGTIISDINLKIDNKPSKSSYSGRLRLIDFDLGSYTTKSMLGLVSLNGRIKGKGLSATSANFEFNGQVDAIDINNYKYQGIITNGNFFNQYFKGSLVVNDPNLKLNATGELDLRESNQKVKVNGILTEVRPDTLNILKNISLVQAEINADIQGFSLDSINGMLFLENVYAENIDQTLEIDHLTLSSFIKDDLREVELLTEKANVKIAGDFSYQQLARDLVYMVKEYEISLKNNADSIAAFYTGNPPPDSDLEYFVDLDAEFSNIDDFLQLFVPDLSLHNQTDISIRFEHSERNIIAGLILIDSLSYQDNLFLQNQINLDASKVITQNEILASLDLQTAKIITAGGAILEDIIFSNVWSNDYIDFNWYNRQEAVRNVNDIYGMIRFYEDSTQIHLNKSLINLLNDTWTIQDNNLVTISDRVVKVENLNIGSSDQMITVNGVVSNNPEEILSITVNRFDLQILNQVLPKNISGRVSGEFALSNLYTTPTVVSNFYIGNLYIDQFLVGDIFSSNDWNNTNKLFDIQFIVNRNDTPIILVNGIFDPFNSKNALDLNASFMNARLNLAEPFVETLFSEIKGRVNGKIHITGPLEAPVLEGSGTLQRAGLKVNYLNTAYDVQGQWTFSRNKIGLQHLIIQDKNNKVGTLNGEFTHKDFKDFVINLTGTMEEFLVLNTTAKDNDLFYGTGIATGSLSITGPIEDITIKSKARTERGTRIFIPIGGTETSAFEEFISFVDFSDTISINKARQDDEIKISGLNLEFDLDITEDAYSEIIFDITSGDIIRGRGNGQIGLKIDTNGEFSMIGTYEFVSGGYNFTMYNIVNKEFSINPKSKITWTGDPYAGIMDIDASYELSTSLAPLVDTIYHDMADIKRIYPVSVLLGLNGPLLTPDIDFEILIDDYPKSNTELDTQIKAFLNTIAVDQQELNRQVFSLLILRNFSYPNSFSSSGSIGSSVSEFVSNQLSYWISQVDDNLTIDMDLSDLDADALKAFQLRVSYEFMEGKLIVTRDGGFTDPNNDASVESIAGDWTLEYLLSDDGKLRVKLFNKTNYNQLNSTTGSDNQALISGGFSLIYTTSFNSFNDLFKRKKEKKEKKSQDDRSTSALKPEENTGDGPEN